MTVLWDNPIRRLGYAESKGRVGTDGTVSLKAIPLDSTILFCVPLRGGDWGADMGELAC